MPHNPETFPYLVFGDGMMPSKTLLRKLRMPTKLVVPMPAYFYTTTIEKAREAAEKMSLWHETVLICKIEEVTK